jgi:transglutaminase-like putative cysteine protease
MAWQWWDGFDKRFCGKWISEQFEINGSEARIFLDIRFTDNVVEVYFNYNMLFNNNRAFYEEYSDNSLYFFHNDRHHRMEYILTLENDGLIKCKYSLKNSYGISGVFEQDLEFTPLSEDEEKKYKHQVEPKDTAKIDILKEYADYGEIKTNGKFEYKFDERENIRDIIEKYNLDELVNGRSDVEIAIALMHWFCARYRHGNPQGGLAGTRTLQGLMEFADRNEGRTNCRGLSLALAQLMRAYNVKAFHITCYPYEEPFSDCHVVVCVYCDSLKKYIMLDPSANLYLKNSAGEIIGVEELRDVLIAGGELTPNDEATNWGNEGSMTDLTAYRDYMAKNLIRIERSFLSCYGNDSNGGSVILIPEKYMQNEAKNFNAEMQSKFITSRECFWQI